ncbi:hypothetical protein FGADI_13239 [Fusarium gaditjirri]|uniref:Uncharacterized protein n=1 Tax=Fusarium gaditjirri TaxID=282569 RepID=A0A8H4SQ45_9HYPO|nr:hypothetical protein FGADI_13239 [Fusarium gaditjirri]
MSSRTYPAWFYKVRSLVQDRKARGQGIRYGDHDLPTQPQDYDEDLLDAPMMAKTMTKRPNQDDDEWSVEAELQKELEWEKKEIRPIKEAFTRAQQSSQRNSAPLKKLGGRMFKLWSTDHVKHCTAEVAPTQYIEFYDPEEFRGFNSTPDGTTDGHIYMVSTDVCEIDPFTPPRNPSLRTVRLDGNRGRHTFDVQFFDNHHLILKMPKDLVFYKQAISPPPEAPDVFTYYGICEDYSTKLYREKKRREARGEQRRSASPA